MLMRPCWRFLEKLPNVKWSLGSLSGSFCRTWRVHSGHLCLCCLVGGKGRFFWALLFVVPPFDAFDALRIVSWIMDVLGCAFWLVDRLFVGNSTLISSVEAYFDVLAMLSKGQRKEIDACLNETMLFAIPALKTSYSVLLLTGGLLSNCQDMKPNSFTNS